MYILYSSAYSRWLLAYCYSQLSGTMGLATATSVSTWLDDHNSKSISGDCPLDETLNLGLWCCSYGNSMNFPLGLICAIFFSFFPPFLHLLLFLPLPELEPAHRDHIRSEVHRLNPSATLTLMHVGQDLALLSESSKLSSRQSRYRWDKQNQSAINMLKVKGCYSALKI